MSRLTRLQKLEQETSEQTEYIIIRQAGETREQALDCVKLGDSVIYIDIGYDLPTTSD